MALEVFKNFVSDENECKKSAHGYFETHHRESTRTSEPRASDTFR